MSEPGNAPTRTGTGDEHGPEPAAPSAPDAILQLASRRVAARAARDFAAADALRDEIRGAGWVVTDTPSGFALAPAPPFSTVPTVAALLAAQGGPARDERRCGVGLVVDGWADDVRTCVEALLAHTPEDVVVVGLDLGDVDGAGRTLAELADEYPGRLEHHHLERPCGWGEARTALLHLDASGIHVVMEPSTVLEGDALSPLLAVLDEAPSASVAAWQGVDAASDWLSFEPAGPGEVDAALGYLFAVRRADALAAGGFPTAARYYRNADMEFSFVVREELRAQGRGRVVVPDAELAVRQGRHHGYHDTPPEVRDRESKRNYDRFLARFRGRDETRGGTGGTGDAGG